MIACNFVVNWSINIDPLSSIMLVVVSVISALVHIYSIEHIKHDPINLGLCLICLYLHSMLVLVVSIIFAIIFWM